MQLPLPSLPPPYTFLYSASPFAEQNFSKNSKYTRGVERRQLKKPLGLSISYGVWMLRHGAKMEGREAEEKTRIRRKQGEIGHIGKRKKRKDGRGIRCKILKRAKRKEGREEKNHAKVMKWKRHGLYLNVDNAGSLVNTGERSGCDRR
ncbi:hypothetical protein E2C01_015237 [Portunus trituberculatus]|uniref:Uncharacterized protein n=1 Tax=Portunus trituberculatus TaxID=210409 RepID=A0A5B7DM72_PORTR|nr:hypothetical protein [Portunus trituberculatus]